MGNADDDRTRLFERETASLVGVEVHSSAREIQVVADAFAMFSVAVFPGPYGQKGTLIPGWRDLPAVLSWDITRAWVRGVGLDQVDPDVQSWRAGLAIDHRRNLEGTWRRHVAPGKPINIAARTGPELGVIDLDGKNGVHPDRTLPQLLKLLPGGVAVSRTGKGYHVFFRPTRNLGDGTLPEYGAELFTAGHLVNLPPSRHPTGVDYEWVKPPGGGLPIVDLEALGLLPEIATEPNAKTGPRCGRLTPAPDAIRAEFERLLASVGIRPRQNRQELHRCPWHNDRQASLSINWESAVFYDFGGCAQGGIGALRRLVSGTQRPTA